MICVAKSKVFNYKNFIKTLLIVFLYAFVLRFYNTPINIEFISQINIRVVFSQVMDMLTFSLLVNLTLIANAFCYLTDLVFGFTNMKFCDYLTKELLKIGKIRNLFKINKRDLDVSNPFLYSNKTCALLE